MDDDIKRIPWLDGPPRRAGYYWWVETRDLEGYIAPSIRRVYRAWLQGDERLVCELDALGVMPVDSMPGVWAGPLPMPGPPKGKLLKIKF